VGAGHEALGLARILPIKLPNLLTPVAFIASRSALSNPNVRILGEIIQRSIAPYPATRTNYKFSVG
jgi:hypothetical protein